MPQTAQLLSTIVTTGQIAQPILIQPQTLVDDWVARFQSTFDEYRVVRAVIRIRPVSSSSGVTKFWFDEKTTSAPTQTQSYERYTMTVVNNNANSRGVIVMTWVPHDLLDLQFTAITTAVTPVTFKVYTDNAAYGSPITATPLWLIEPMLTVEFRGLKST